MTTDAQPPAGEPTRELAAALQGRRGGRRIDQGALGSGRRRAAVRGPVHQRRHPACARRRRVGATTEELRAIYAAGQDQAALIAGLYLMPFAGIMFLWFIAVIRDQIGEREDRFFATVFLGSGLIFVSVLFVATAIATAPIVGVRYLGQQTPSGREVDAAQALTYTLMFGYGTRAAAVFLLTMSTLGVRSRAFPLWLARAGYVVAIVLLLVVAFFDWIILVFPAWIALVSLFVMRREKARRLAALPPEPARDVPA